MRRRLRGWWALLALLPLGSGCAGFGTQLRFKTVVAYTGKKSGGWQAACLEALFQNMTTHDSFVCLVSMEMPLRTWANGDISHWDAADIATECIQEASEHVVQPAPPSVPSAVACGDFRNELGRLLSQKVIGSRVSARCKTGVPRTRVGF